MKAFVEITFEKINNIKITGEILKKSNGMIEKSTIHTLDAIVDTIKKYLKQHRIDVDISYRFLK